MSIQVTLLDKGLGDIKNTIASLVKLAIKKYPKSTKKSEKVAKNIPLKIIFKRGPIVMKNGEYLKENVRGLAETLTLNAVEVDKVLSRKNLNWGILGYGDPKGGLKELMKFAKTKLNPAQLRGDNQDLQLEINKYTVEKKDGKLQAQIIITVPDKSLGGKDVESKVLEKEGYLGINAWKQKAKEMLKENEPLDKAIIEILENKAKLTDMMVSEDEDNSSLEDSAYKDIRDVIKDIMLELEDTGWLNYDDGPEAVKEYLTDKGIEFDPQEVNKIFEDIWFDMFHTGE